MIKNGPLIINTHFWTCGHADMWIVLAKHLLPPSWCGAEVLRDIVDGVPVSVAVVLGPVRVEVDGLHGPHEGVPHPHPVLHHHVDILWGHNPVPGYSRCPASAGKGEATTALNESPSEDS